MIKKIREPKTTYAHTASPRRRPQDDRKRRRYSISESARFVIRLHRDALEELANR